MQKVIRYVSSVDNTMYPTKITLENHLKTLLFNLGSEMDDIRRSKSKSNLILKLHRHRASLKMMFQVLDELEQLGVSNFAEMCNDLNGENDISNIHGNHGWTLGSRGLSGEYHKIC